MKRYSEILQINPIFQNSINLQFDINSEAKIIEYIPTKEACSILRIYISSLLKDGNKNDRATVLYGPYGKGKSFLVLVLLYLISTNPESESYRKLVRKIKDVDSELSELIIALNKERTRLLPVIVNSDYGDIAQAVLVGLNEAFEREHINGASYKSNYDIALEVVENWMQYSAPNQIIERCVAQGKLDLDSIHEGLKQKNSLVYEEFCNLYSCINGGMSFNPLTKNNILTTLQNIKEILPAKYSGVFIVFDEFSKFIESRAVGLSQQLKVLQDVFELAVRSDSKNQIHFCCINHKKLSSYSKSIEESNLSSFRTVEGRVKEISFTRTIGENYWLISQAIKKKEGFEKFWSKYENEHKDTFSWYLDRNYVDEEDEDSLFKGCFPLNPIAVFTLIQLSEMVAQNERTLFTFIADNNANSVNSFIHNNKDGLYKVDRIYDYFSSLFEKEEGNTKNVWMNAEAVLKEVDDDREKRIIKSIALSQIISDSRMFPSNGEFVSASLDGEQISDALTKLKDKSLISRDIITEQYYLAHYSEKEIKETINEYRLSKKLQNISEELGKITPIHYVPARKYNAVNKMVRFYKVSYIDSETFIKLTRLSKRSDVFCDGTIYLVYSFKEINEEKIKDAYIKLKKDACVIVGYSLNNLSKEFLESLSDYCALRDLVNEKNFSDSLFINEMKMMRNRKKEAIRYVLNSIFSSYTWLSEYPDDGLTEIIFKQLKAEYSSSPLINNELLNKEQITKTYQKPRDVIVERILKKSGVEDLSPTSAEMSVFKSVFATENNKVDTIVKEVVKLIEDKEGEKVQFIALINFLSSAPYGVRKGVMPLIIAKAISELPDYFIIYYGIKEIDLNPANIAKAVDKPSEYRYRIEKGTKEKEEFLEGLGQEYGVELSNHFWEDLKRVVDAATKFVSVLPPIVRSGTVDSALNIKKESRAMINALLKYDINPYDTVFLTLNDCFGTKCYSDTLKEVQNTNKTLKASLSWFAECFTNNIKKIFDAPKESSLKSIFDSWIIVNNIKERSIKYLSSTEKKLFEVLTSTKMTFSDVDVVNILSESVTSVVVADWQKDRTFEVTETLKSVKDKMENAEKIEERDNSESDAVNFTKLGEMARRTVLDSINEYGESITDEEKVNILKSIIKELEK